VTSRRDQFSPPFSSSRTSIRRERGVGIVAAYFLDETLGVLAADEHLERVTERKVGERASSTTA
jgi:hypothetical protein